MKRFLQSAGILAFALFSLAATAQTVPVNPPPTGSGTGSSTGTYSGGTTPTSQPMNPTRTGGDGVYQNGSMQTVTPQNGANPTNSSTQGSYNTTISGTPSPKEDAKNAKLNRTPRGGESAYQMGDARAKNGTSSDVEANTRPTRAARRDKGVKSEKRTKVKTDRRTMSDGTVK